LITLPSIWTVNLDDRCRQTEIMEEPDVNPEQHWEALRALERINAVSHRDRLLWKHLSNFALINGRKPLRVLDIATGGGDLPVGLWHRAKEANAAMFFDGCDCSEQALVYARRQAERNHAHVRFFQHDALNGPLPEGYDIAISSLFLHHLDGPQVISFLRNLRQSVRLGILMYDLQRIYAGYLLAYFGTRVLTRSPMVHIDGPLSVRAAFTVDEIQKLARQAGLEGACVRRVFPVRMLLSWRRP
jgi:2-polyprenyl-3-methyl-5-hydroxy-6-metoxy-1,4-benzoquinol methylase